MYQIKDACGLCTNFPTSSFSVAKLCLVEHARTPQLRYNSIQATGLFQKSILIEELVKHVVCNIKPETQSWSCFAEVLTRGWTTKSIITAVFHPKNYLQRGF